MQKIVPHFWFDKEAREATAFYTSLFANSHVVSVTELTNTPSGDSDLVVFKLAGQDFMAISAGPYFKINPSISMFVVFNDETEIDKVWNALSEGGKVLMAYNASYPWAKKYGWVQDKYGVTWQLSLSEYVGNQQITPLLMFTGVVAGKAKEAAEYYASVFPSSSVDAMIPYEKGDGDQDGFIKHGRFTLSGQGFMSMDSSIEHDFNFNEAVSFVVSCDTQEEIDMYWSLLSSVPEAEQCGWCKDKYGVSWQIVPSKMGQFMTSGDKAITNRVTQAFLKMKKFDIAELERAYRGEV
jgi:predicted 3-demethylubiquinone-9 3-methyltransferase (glyoxalase superfamily)